MNTDSSDDELDTNEIYFTKEYQLLTSDDLVIGHNYYVIDSNKKGKHILYNRPNQNYSSGPFTYYGKYVEKYIQPKLLPDRNNDIIFINIYKFFDNDETLPNKIKYTKDNFDKKNVDMYGITGVSTYKHSYLYLDADTLLTQPPSLVNNVKIVNKSARNIPIPRGVTAIPVATMLPESPDEQLPYYGMRRYFGGKMKKRKTIRKNKNIQKKHTRRKKIHK